MPRAKRYTEIADHYRAAILSGELAPGDKLPSNRDLAGTWQTTAATVTRALSSLQVEGFIRTTPRGTFVADVPPVTMSPRDRLGHVSRVRSALADGESVMVTSATLLVPPVYVAELFGLEPGDQVVRREWTMGRGQARTQFGVTWYPAQFAAMVPDLLSTAPGRHGGVLARVMEATGRTPNHGRDDMHGREADAREASHLGVRVGAPILAMAWRYSDDGGVMEYGEVCLPARLTIGYEYQV
jgi:GntR family transcriptional regulator